MSRKRRSGEDMPRMETRIPHAPEFDYWERVVSYFRRSIGRMPELPAPAVPSVQPPLEPHGTNLCFTGVCARCGRDLISATGRVRPGTVCHHLCTGEPHLGDPRPDPRSHPEYWTE